MAQQLITDILPEGGHCDDCGDECDCPICKARAAAKAKIIDSLTANKAEIAPLPFIRRNVSAARNPTLLREKDACEIDMHSIDCFRL